MSKADGIAVLHQWTTWGRSGGVIAGTGDEVPWEIASMAQSDVDRATDRARVALEAGQSAHEAAALLASFRPEPHVLEAHTLGQDIILLDDTATLHPNNAVSSLKVVTSVAARQRRVVVVAGDLSFDSDSDYDSLGSYGAVMVRLNVNQVFAVGPKARALFLSVGMEGSWDGESQHCLGVEDAYDEVRAFVRPEDVVLVMGSQSLPLSPIVERLRSDLS
jgi:UDP-N-acetylmuramyl pentapeptide synthase